MRRGWAALGVAAAIAGAARADPALTALHDTLASARAQRGAPYSLRGAGPAFDGLKHGLRAWVERRLAALAEAGDPTALGGRLNEALEQADLLCADPQDPQKDRCQDPDGLGGDARGYLGPVAFRWQADCRILVLVTAIGIDECGFDESAYAYRWDGGWRRVWQSEQSDYTEQGYHPQHLDEVLVSAPSQHVGRLVLTLGEFAWCTSTLQSVSYRLWRLAKDGGEPRLLLDRTELNRLTDRRSIRGRLDPPDVLIEFDAPSLDSMVYSLPQPRHFRIEGDRVTRIDPIALDPRGFVEQWLSSGWSDSASWSDAAEQAGLRPWHARLHGRLGHAASYLGPTTRCPARPDLWSVGLTRDPDAEQPEAIWFLVRWRPPYRFSMAGIGATPPAGCGEPAPQAGAAPTLFPAEP